MASEATEAVEPDLKKRFKATPIAKCDTIIEEPVDDHVLSKRNIKEHDKNKQKMASIYAEPTLEECFMVTYAEECDPNTKEPVDGHILKLFILEDIEEQMPPAASVMRRPRSSEDIAASFVEKYPRFAPTSPTRDSAFKNAAERANTAPSPDLIAQWAAGALEPSYNMALFPRYHIGIQEMATDQQQIAAIQQIKYDFPVQSKRILSVVRAMLSKIPRPASTRSGDLILRSRIQYLLKDHSRTQLEILEAAWS